MHFSFKGINLKSLMTILLLITMITPEMLKGPLVLCIGTLAGLRISRTPIDLTRKNEVS